MAAAPVRTATIGRCRDTRLAMRANLRGLPNDSVYMAMTFVAPHSLHARPLVVPRGLDLTVVNRSAEHALTVLVDGRAVGELVRDESLSVALGDETCRLALLPEVTFFGRYHEVFP